MNKYRRSPRYKWRWLMVGCVSAVRLISPILLWWAVLPAFIWMIAVDAVDGDILARFGIEREWYQHWDKWMDQWLSLGLLVYLLQYFTRDTLFYILLGSFFWRLLGTALFYVSKKEWLLMVFPNVFWKLFFFAIVLPQSFAFTFILPAPWPMVTVLLLATLILEWIIHIARFDLTALVFRIPRKW